MVTLDKWRLNPLRLAGDSPTKAKPDPANVILEVDPKIAMPSAVP